MEENKNTYIFKKNIVIEKKRETIIPEAGDEFILCENLKEVYQLVSYDRFNHDQVVEDYSSENLGEHVTDYQLCHRLSINGNMYKFFGYKMKYPNGITKRKFFLYETD